MELNSKELLAIVGGFSLSGTFINSIVKGINSIVDLGRSLGSAIRRISLGKMCSC